MAFLDEDDAFATGETERPRPGPPTPAARQRQILIRRLVAVGIVLLILLLLVLGVRAILDARKGRAFDNYLSDLDSLTTESKQLSDGFFNRLDDPGDLNDISLRSEVSADRGAAEGLLNRARNLDPPGEMDGAQESIVLAFELRRDALAQIASRLPTALGDEGSRRATRRIARDMETFLASDVIYRRGQAAGDQVLEDEGRSGEIPNSEFLPDGQNQEGLDWLQESTVESALAGVTGEGGGGAGGGVRGLGLVPEIVVRPGDVTVAAGSEATISGGGQKELDVTVENQGESPESEVEVQFTLGETISGNQTISSTIEPNGGRQTVNLPISQDPPTGEPLLLEVEVVPVQGEEITENNTGEFTLTFEN